MQPLHIVVTAGPTREPMDPVRFLSNRSSGKMGYALAEAARLAGHRVTLLSGPVALAPPRRVRFHRFETAAELRRLLLKEARQADVVIMAAAVADYQPVRVIARKIKSTRKILLLRLKRTPDILARLGRRRRGTQLLVGFAAETDHLVAHARRKLKAKNLDAIVANRVGREGAGFDSDYNRVTVLKRNGAIIAFPRMKKKRLARNLLGLLVPP